MTPTAQEILNSPVYKAAVERVKDELIQEFTVADPKDMGTLGDIAYRLGALGGIDLALRRALRGSMNLQK